MLEILNRFKYHIHSTHPLASCLPFRGLEQPEGSGTCDEVVTCGYGGSGTWFTISQDSRHQRLLPNGRCCLWSPAKQGCWTFNINMTPQAVRTLHSQGRSGIFVTGIKMRELLSCCRIFQQMSTSWNYYHMLVLPSIDFSQADSWWKCAIPPPPLFSWLYLCKTCL